MKTSNLRWISRITLLGACVLAATTCGPETTTPPTEAGRRYASGVCEALVQCGCIVPFDGKSECFDTLRTQFDDALASGYTLDEGCLDEMLDALREHPCGSTVPPYGVCRPLVGSHDLGQPCTYRWDLPLSKLDECAPPYACFAGACENRNLRGLGEPCAGTSYCSSRLYCDRRERRCLEKQPLGATCEPSGCRVGEVGLYCKGGRPDALGVCTEQVELGGECDPLDWRACAGSDAYCDPRQRVCVEEKFRTCSAYHEHRW